MTRRGDSFSPLNYYVLLVKCSEHSSVHTSTLIITISYSATWLPLSPLLPHYSSACRLDAVHHGHVTAPTTCPVLVAFGLHLTQPHPSLFHHLSPPLSCYCNSSHLLSQTHLWVSASNSPTSDLISYRSCHMSSRPLLFGSVLACVFILLWSGAQPACSIMAKDEGSVHIVYVQKSPEHADNVEDHHLGILETVCGSREAAKEKMLYSYSQAMSGFSAKLTDDQVKTLQETPGVLQVVKDQVHTIHASRGVGGSGPRVTKVGGNVISSLGGAGNLQ